MELLRAEEGVEEKEEGEEGHDQTAARLTSAFSTT
jgi:hypothetical protein